MKTDMSPHAVTTRLRRVSQLRRLCLSLGKAKPVEREGSTSVDAGRDAKTKLRASPRDEKV